MHLSHPEKASRKIEVFKALQKFKRRGPIHISTVVSDCSGQEAINACSGELIPHEVCFLKGKKYKQNMLIAYMQWLTFKSYL